VLEIVETHPTIATISNGQAVTDLQLVTLEATLRQELRRKNVHLSESNIRKAFNLKVIGINTVYYFCSTKRPTLETSTNSPGSHS
jgi:type I restriction enzyme R subunit